MVDAKSSVLGFNTRMPAWMYKNQTTIYTDVAWDP